VSAVDARVMLPKDAAAPVHLMSVVAVPGERTVAHGALWDGVLNATSDDDIDGPSPIESLMAALAGCLARNLRSMADDTRLLRDRVRRAVDLALRYGTITRTLARACLLTIHLSIDRDDPEELPDAR